MMVRVFADEYPAEVSGLVLIDPTNEEAVIAAGDPTLPIIERRVQGLLAELGVVRLIGPSLVSDAVGGNPPPEVLDAVPVLYGAGSQAATVAELEASLESARQVEQTVQPGALRDLPVVVISAANGTTTDRARHTALAALSSHGQHIVADSGGHYVHYDDPDLVIEAVRSIM
jgi:pimeloyl-ACP methyl ester carboxylesterase